MREPYSVALVEDDPDFIYLIQRSLEKSGRLTFVGAATRGEDGVALVRAASPHVVLMDLNLPGGMDGVAAARAIRLSTPAKVLMLTSCEEPDTIIHASKRAFASGYIFKSQCQALVDVVCRIAEGITPQALFIRELALSILSPAERSIVDMLAKGNDAPHSAEKTIANQKTSIFRKLGLSSTAELVHIFKDW